MGNSGLTNGGFMSIIGKFNKLNITNNNLIRGN